MAKENETNNSNQIPDCATGFIKQVIKKIRYRKKVRADVQAELLTHFEDELQDCKTEQERLEKAESLIEEFGDIKLLATLIRRAKKRCRPLWQIVTIRCFHALIISIAFFIIYVGWFFTGKPVITKDYVAEIKELIKRSLDESQNAALLYSEAARLWSEDSNDDKFSPINNYYEATPEEKILIKKSINHNEKYFALFVKGTQKPYYWPLYETNEHTEDEGVFSLTTSYLTPMRQILISLYWRAMLRVEEGDIIGGLNDIKSCYLVGSQLKTSKSMLEYLVGTSFDYMVNRVLVFILNDNKIDTKVLADFQNDFESINKSENFRINYSGEKILILDEIQRGFTSDGIGNGHLYLPEFLKLLSLDTFRSNPVEPGRVALFYHILIKHPNKKETLKTLDKLMNYWDKYASTNPSKINIERSKWNEELQTIVKDNWFLEVLFPVTSIEFQINRSYQNKADMDATLMIVAITRYKQDKGEYPNDLNELVTTGYLKELPLDPFSDKPLVYKRTGNDFILYSYGLNCKDDGGKIYRRISEIYEMWSKEDSDAVFWPVIEPEQ